MFNVLKGLYLLVSHIKKFIFIKTAKTAGTSVESYFEQYCVEPGKWTQAHERNQQVTDYGMVGGRGSGRFEVLHAHLSAEKIKLLLPEFQWNEYFKFSVIRNPYDRLVSRFFFNIKRDTPELIDFNKRDDVINAFRLFVTQHLYKIENHLLIDGVLAPDYLIRYESLNKDIAEVCRKIGVEFDPSRIPVFKSGIRENTFSMDDLYDVKTKEYVEKNYLAELERFNYSYPH
ncbi:MAG: hypothetical protein ACI85O_001787 [Saprospiraceae bacterium]